MKSNSCRTEHSVIFFKRRPALLSDSLFSIHLHCCSLYLVHICSLIICLFHIHVLFLPDVPSTVISIIVNGIESSCRVFGYTQKLLIFVHIIFVCFLSLLMHTTVFTLRPAEFKHIVSKTYSFYSSGNENFNFCLRPTCTKRQRQCCNDACNTALIDHNRVT